MGCNRGQCNRGQTTFIALALSEIVACPLLPAADGLNRPKTMFDVMVPKMDNNYFFSKSYIPTPYGTAGAIYLLGVGGKGYELGDKIHEGPKNEN